MFSHRFFACHTFFFFKHKTAYEMRIMDWSSDVCSSYLFFDAAKYPEIKFVSTSVKPTSATEADIAGNLTIHGVTRPVTIKAEFTGQGGNPMTKAATVGFVGRTQIQRSEFGVGKFRSEERRVGKESVSPCRCRWSP